MSVFKRALRARGGPLYGKCQPFHKWNDKRPVVDQDLHEVQHPELIGKECDCGRVTYNEKACGCSHDRWGMVEEVK